MSRKKRIRKQEGAGTEPAAPVRSKAASKAPSKPANPATARRIAVLGIGLVGLFMGLLTGINHIPATPATLTDPAARAVFEGAVLGLQPLDWLQGLQLAFCGAVFGLSAGFSLLLEPARTMSGWLLGVLGLAVGLGLGMGMLPAALGWMIGFGSAFRANPVTQPVTEGARPVLRP